MNTKPFTFDSHGERLSGFVDVPAGATVRAMIVIVHGYGKTDVAGQTSYYDLRSRFSQLGISSLIWDKPGCGQSTGTFDADQSVASSAEEVLDAIRHAREARLPGTEKVGLWGISRPKIAFWISVSGTDAEENFPYLLESNLRIEGRTAPEIKLLLAEWRRGFEITSTGGIFTDYLPATQTLRRDPFRLLLSVNHNLQQARTGGLREMLQMSEHRASVGYYEAMEDWLRVNVLK